MMFHDFFMSGILVLDEYEVSLGDRGQNADYDHIIEYEDLMTLHLKIIYQGTSTPRKLQFEDIQKIARNKKPGFVMKIMDNPRG